MKKVFSALQLAIASAAILFLGFGIGTNASMPDYARVYLDATTKTYLALPCLAQWHLRPNETTEILRMAKASEARELQYEPDNACRETGAFAPHDRSLTGLLLVKLGILSPAKHWWDAPYRADRDSAP